MSNNKPKKEFLKELQSSIMKFDEIDKQVDWSELPPEWWLDMMDIRQKMFNISQKFKA